MPNRSRVRARAAAGWGAIWKKGLVLTGLATTTLTVMAAGLGRLADILQVLQGGGWVLLLAVPLGAVGWALLDGQRKSHKPDTRAIAFGVVLLLLAAIIAVPKAIDIAGSSSDRPAAAPMTAPSTAPSSPAPTGTPVPATTGCPLPDPTDPVIPPVDVRVLYWCHGDVYLPDGSVDSANYQIKVRPRLVNNTTTPMSISIDNPSSIRLLVEGPQIDQRWSPPTRTRALGDKPILVECNGKTFWGVPPNVPRDAVLTKSGGYSGFVTSWDYDALTPGQVAFKPLRTDADGNPVQEGNLVFQVPLEDHTAARIYGLAVIDPAHDDKVLGVAVYDKDWGTRLHPTQF